MRYDQIAIVENVMTDESIEELGNLLPELRRFSLELCKRLSKTVGDLDILAAELPQQLPLACGLPPAMKMAIVLL